MKRIVRLLSICLLGLLYSNSNLSSQDKAGLSKQEFDRLMKEVNASMDKPWRQIPWKISLLDAQNDAAKQGKPIFIWAMDGHPLGCT